MSSRKPPKSSNYQTNFEKEICSALFRSNALSEEEKILSAQRVFSKESSHIPDDPEMEKKSCHSTMFLNYI